MRKKLDYYSKEEQILSIEMQRLQNFKKQFQANSHTEHGIEFIYCYCIYFVTFHNLHT